MDYIMGIDNGGTSTKAAIYDLDGNEIAKCNKNTEMLTPQPFFTERSIRELWNANCYVIREAIARSGVNPVDIVGVGVTGHGNGLYLMGEDRMPARNGIVSTDNRATAYIDKWYADPRWKTNILPKTKQSMWAGQPMALLAWLNDHEPEVCDKTKYILMVKDLIRYYLTDQASLEITDASGINLVNLDTREYDDELLDFFGISNWKDKLPPLIKSSDVGGRVTKRASELTGLVEGTPVSGGVFDIAASPVAGGLVDSDQLFLVTGTWSINEYITSKPVVDDKLFMTSIYPMENKWLVTEASPTSASNLEWFINTFMQSERRECEAVGRSIYDYTHELMASTRPDESDLVFFPYIFGTNAVPNATACFLGATGYHEKKHFLRAVYEGVAFSAYYHIEKLGRVNPNLHGPVRIAGGTTNSMVWMHLFADVLDMPLEIVRVKESGTLGAAMSAAVMTEMYPSIETAADKMIRLGDRVEPNEDNHQIYMQKYKRYRAVMDKMADVWTTLQETALPQPADPDAE